MFIHFIKSAAIVVLFLVCYNHIFKQVNRRLQRERFNKIHQNTQIDGNEKLIWKKIETLLNEKKLTDQKFENLMKWYTFDEMFKNETTVKSITFRLVEEIVDCSNVDIEYFRHFVPAEDFEQYLINK
ncbi:hypothetical protein [Enterococcus faecalis]|uniref:hypothetical protein n=1 Tax=Enterococcus faecalis TaxID=1351 RepID=UPI001F5A04D6|nr:hypothetical protein [Enterococcus faecalis]EKN1413240.1 hypothetical protein [Enterococcus faecalis]